MEKKFAVAYDKSLVSLNAVSYAYDMSQKEDTVEILHVDTGVVNLGSKEALISNIQDEIQKHLNLKQWPANFKIIILYGSIIGALSDYISTNIFDFVIAGTRDKYTLAERWIGTVSLALVKKIKTPIYLIPRFAKFTKIKKAIVASDFHLTNKSLLHEIRIWNNEHKAFLKFLHVRQSSSDDFKIESENIVNILFDKEPADFGFEVAVLNSDHISDSLLSSAYNYKADILIVFSENSSYMNTLIFKSLTKEIIQKATIPVLFLHS